LDPAPDKAARHHAGSAIGSISETGADPERPTMNVDQPNVSGTAAQFKHFPDFLS